MNDEKPMNNEATPKEVDEQIHEESLPEGHNPEVGEPENSASNPTETLSPEEKAQCELADWKDKYFRLYAEFDNYRKRSQRERVEFLATAGGDVIKDMLVVLDDFERAVKANESLEDISAVKEGFNLIHQKMVKRLEARGLKPLESNGQVFNVDFHEAITNIPSPNPNLKGKVVDTVEKGYTLNEKVLRFAKVIVGA